MFVDAMTLERLWGGYIDTRDWKPFPQIGDRAQWESLQHDPRLALTVKSILHVADQVLESEIDPLTGTMYMNFMRNGDRRHYESNSFRRRTGLSHLVIAECLTADGRYLDRIIDHIWAILGEIYWCVPAHNFAGQHEMVVHKAPNPWRADDPLPVPDDEYLDLFNCETAAILAEACYLLQPVLMETVPSLYHLVHRQIEERTLAKLESDKLYGWYHGKNNWTPWCAHNLLVAACHVVDDKSRLISIANKLMVPMQRFFDNMEPSGSCIEGPTYWVVSAGRLAGFIDLVETRFRMDLGFAKNAKFRNFGEHIVKLHIGENKFVNFADGSLAVDLDHGLLSKYARKIDAQALTNLIWNDVNRVATRKLGRSVQDRNCNDHNRQILIHLTRLLFWTPEVSPSLDRTCEETVWLSDMEVMIARQSEKPGDGLALSCIAGSNDPRINHHSHNDVGHFSVYLDGEPLIIDLGQGAYSRSTFGETRYDTWHISSEGHNVPKINGILQRPGEGSNARDVQFSRDGTISRLSLDATAAYFAEPGSNSIRRNILFDNAVPRIVVEDCVKLRDGLAEFELPIHVSGRTAPVECEGGVRIEGRTGDLLLVPKNLYVRKIETLAVTDPVHLSVWGDRIQKVTFAARDAGTGAFSLEVLLERKPAPIPAPGSTSANAPG